MLTYPPRHVDYVRENEFKHCIKLRFNSFVTILLFAMCPSVFVGVEGFTLPNQFIAKEVTILLENNEFTNVLLAPPLGYYPTIEEIRSILYTTRNLHGIPYTEGDMPYAKLNDLFSRLRHHTVYCYGEHTRKLVQCHIPFTPVINIEHEGFEIADKLRASCCGRSHSGRHCSFSKAIAVKNYCADNM